MNNKAKIRSVKAVILFLILLGLSGMAAIVAGDSGVTPPNKFAGTVTLNGADASPGTIIYAYIDEEFRGSIVVESVGEYVQLEVNGNASDDGETITFTVCGATADQNATWHEYEAPRILNLTAVDDEAPAVENANANPTSIVNGTDTTQLNVTVIDGCRCTVGNVTVNLSAIGGLEAQEMDRVGDTDVYSVTTNATEGTALGAYCLYVNASDVFGQCNTSVCIALEVTTSDDWRDEWMGPDSDGGTAVTTSELQDAIHHWLEDIPVRGYIMSTADLQEIIAVWLSG